MSRKESIKTDLNACDTWINMHRQEIKRRQGLIKKMQSEKRRLREWASKERRD